MTKYELLISRISQLSEDSISSLLDTTALMLETNNSESIPVCPSCSSPDIIRYGHRCGKQRFLCKDCKRTFVPTTNTVMANSHFPASVWKEAIADTLRGNSIDYSAKRLRMYHQAVFDMRHKILLALQGLPETAGVCLGEVSEFDETFALDCYKGKKLDAAVSRKPRKHGAKAEKRGITSEYLCICTGIQRKGEAFAATPNRAKPSAGELLRIFEGHIADGTLALCDGLRSYHALPGIADCIVRDCTDQEEGKPCFYHLNTVNGFHSYIKQRYHFYRGVASKYINRYNVLFSSTYRNTEGLIKHLTETVLAVTGTDYYHSNKDIREAGLLLI